MSSLMAAEWLKLRKRWMPRILLIILLIVVGLVFWGIGTSSNRSNLFFPRGLVAGLVISGLFTSFLAPVLSASWAGNEYGWGTIRLVLSHRPSREQYLAAALSIVLLSVGMALVAVLIMSGLLGVLIGALAGPKGQTSSQLPSTFLSALVKSFFAVWYATGFYVVLAFAAGTIFRSGAVGIGVGIGVNIAESVAQGILGALGGVWRSAAEHFPGAYAGALLRKIPTEALPSSFTSPGTGGPSVTESLLGLGAYIAVLLAITAIVVRNRDVTA